jgi:hypothetical protein
MHHFRKVGMSVAAVALAASGIVAAFAVQASAASGPHGKFTCTSISGSVSSGFVTISGCSGSAVPGTGGSSQPLPFASLVSGGTVTWVNNQTTTIDQPVLNGSKKPTHCPGYVKPSKTNPSPSEPTLEQFTAHVTADTTGLKVVGKVKGYACIDQSGNITAPKPSKFS